MSDAAHAARLRDEASWLGGTVRVALAGRAAALVLTLGWAFLEGGVGWPLIVTFALAGTASAVPLVWWEGVAPALLARPAYLAGELVLSTLILIATGVDGPFFTFTLGTALIGGLVYSWPGAALFGVTQVAAYYYALSYPGASPAGADGFQELVGLPSLYLFAAAGGAVMRDLITRSARVQREATAEAARAAADRERARLAREMHDSIAKTVSGIALGAAGLARRIERDPAGAGEQARQLAADAQRATREARSLLGDLRGEDPERPVAEVVVEVVERFAAESGLPARAVVEEVATPPRRHAVQLYWILREALRNVERHAHATQVVVKARAEPGRCALIVSDNGAGFEPDLDSLAAHGHYGLVGMRERARSVGGDLTVRSRPGHGTALTTWVPLEAGRDFGKRGAA
ncbi:MAG TPA: histidine kinase [Thermoleophilaceae bacterium]|jgi:signal transduction histidine kinase